MSAVTEAMRQQLLDVLKEEFTPKMLAKLIRVASAAKQYLLAGDFLEKGGEIDDGDLAPQQKGSFLLSGAYGLNSETYGAKIIREVIATLPAIMCMQKETPEALVRAIAEAKASGLTELAAELEEKLTGKELKPLVVPPVGEVPGEVEKAPGRPMTFAVGQAVDLPVPAPAGPPIQGTVRAVGVDVETQPDLPTQMGFGPIGAER